MPYIGLTAKDNVANKDVNGGKLILDADADTSITADTDDQIDIEIAGSDEIKITAAMIAPATADGSALGGTSNEWSDLYLADGSVIYFGADQDVTITHDHNDGLILKSIATDDDNPLLLTLQTGETTTVADEPIVQIHFQVPDEASGTDAILVCAGIEAVAEGTFSSSSNATKLSFLTASSEAAAEKMSLSSAGALDVTGDITGSTLNADGDTATGDNAAIGYTSAEGLILTGQGSTNDITIKRDDDTAVLEVATGQSDIEVTGGSIFFGTASEGVYLGVTSATAANLLDDYEEGTWTPAFTSTSATFAYAQQVGSYTKVGNLVHCEFRLALSGSPGGTTTNGTLISGQPFTAATVSNLYYAFHIGHFFNINLDSNEQAGIAGQIGSQGTTIELKGMGDTVGEQGIQAASLGSAAEFRGSFSYRTA